MDKWKCQGYQNLFEGKKNVLSVLSSGDQIFNMLLSSVIKFNGLLQGNEKMIVIKK